MASKNKMKKLKNSFYYKTYLKNKISKLKRGLFFTASQRYFEKTESFKNEEL